MKRTAMNKRKATVLAAILLCCLVLAGTAFAQASAQYRLMRGAQANAGGPMASASYAMKSILGHSSAIGASQSNSYSLRAGYWSAPMRGAAPAYQLFLPVIRKNAGS